MYRALRYIFVSLFLLMLPAWTLAKTPNMHVVIFADTGDSKIGPSVATDVQTIRNMVSQIDKVLATEGVKTDVQVFQGSNCSYRKLQSFLNDFNCKDDIVFFVYNGHGGRSHSDDATSKFPRMCLGSSYVNEWMKISDLNDKLRSKNPRLMVTFTDCCNSYYDRRSTEKESSLMGSTMSVDGAGIKELFLNNKGEVCITAASPGEYGWCNQAGGYLTLNFKNELQNIDKKGQNATWQELFKNTSDQTYKDTKRQYDLRNITKTQRPVYEVKVKKSPLGSDTSNNTPNTDNNSNTNNNTNNNNNGNNTNNDNNNNTDNNDNNSVTNDDDGGYTIDDDDTVSDDDDWDSVTNDDDGYDSDSDYTDDEDYEYDDEGHPVLNQAKSFGRTFMHFLIIFVIGLIFFMIPKWADLDGTPSTVLKVIGIIIIIKAFYDLITML